MLILVFAWFLVKYHGVSAVPLIPTASKTLLGVEIGGASGRSLYNIIWACFSTTFVCTWVSVHPNIPPFEGRWKSLIRRLKLMFCALIAPELILAWAVKQWIAAANVASFYNDAHNLDGNDPSRWTRTHGFFLLMGGFKLISSPSDGELQNKTNSNEVFETDIGSSSSAEQSLNTSERLPFTDTSQSENFYSGEVLSFEQFQQLIRDPEISVLNIDAEEIKDRSKGDLLSKTIAIVQTTWFIIQCIARSAQGLALTELELVTIALASLNAVTYFFWWNKPLDVKVQVSVFLRSEKTRRVVAQSPSESSGNIVDAVRTLASLLWDILQYQSRYDNYHTGLCYRILRFSAYLPVFLVLIVFAPVNFVLLSFCDIFLTETIPTDAKHVPMFYALKPKHDISALFFIFFGFVFGGLHYIMWNFFEFPTNAERQLWRAASFSITVIPLVFVVLRILSWVNSSGIERTERAELRYTMRKIAVLVNVTFSAVQLLVYILARLLLIVQALVLLREQPASAFHTVDWTKFIPHF